jgi:hypothetical protein
MSDGLPIPMVTSKPVRPLVIYSQPVTDYWQFKKMDGSFTTILHKTSILAAHGLM